MLTTKRLNSFLQQVGVLPCMNEKVPWRSQTGEAQVAMIRRVTQM